jgi:hypothetical protein
MENDDGRKFRELLQEWRVPGVPKSLDERVLGLRRPWWTFLLTGSIRIPVPVGVAVAGILLAMVGALFKQRTAEPVLGSVSLIDFRPVSDLHVRVIRKHASN